MQRYTIPGSQFLLTEYLIFLLLNLLDNIKIEIGRVLLDRVVKVSEENFHPVLRKILTW